MSLDGHDKLCGFQKSTFPLCMYGGLDTFSGRINFVNVWTTNNKPKVVARFYFNYLCESKGNISFVFRWTYLFYNRGLLSGALKHINVIQ